ncbi:cell division protein FtsL [bacterium]|nr:cell division protein FtsL [bacterium]
MNVKQKRRVTWAVIGSLALLIVLFSGPRGCWRQARVRMERSAIEAKIRALDREKKRLEAEKKTLDDPAVVEKIAREEYGMSKKDEKVYRVVPKDQ